MGVSHTVAHLLVVEIQTGEIARVGGVLQAQVDRIGARPHSSLQRSQRTGGAHQLGRCRLRRVVRIARMALIHAPTSL